MNSSRNVCQRKVNPREKSNFIAIATFSYIINLFRKGYKRDLVEDDIYESTSDLDAKKLGRKVEIEWNKERLKNDPSLIKMTLKCFGKEYGILVTTLIILGLAMIIFLPLSISNFISYFKSRNEKHLSSNAYFYGFAIIFLCFLNSIIYSNITLLLYKLGIKIQSSFTSLIYRKLFKLDRSLMSDSTIGQITTLITKDFLLITIVMDYSSNLWFSSVQICVMWIIIYLKLGYVVFSGFAVFMAIIFIMIIYYVKLYNARNETFQNTRKRLLLVQEALQGIRIIKMNCWEKYFQTQIDGVRKSETKGITKLMCYKSFIIGLGAEAFRLCIFAVMITYYLTTKNCTIETAFLIVSLFQTIQKSISVFIPSSIGYIIEFIAILKQLQEFLLTDEISDAEDFSIKSPKEPKINFNNVSVQIKHETILKNISMNIKSGLFVLTGDISSGKTAILRTIFNDLKIIEGNVEVNGSISYAPQEPWLFTASIKQNILFGQKYDKIRYETILRVCALKYDISRMEQGDETIISEDGHNLSKGQQTRITLARAIYKKSDIYLIDDCLSVLDVTVSNFIFRECISKFLNNSLIMFVTQTKSYMTQATAILELKKKLNIIEPNQLIITDNKIDDQNQITNLDCSEENGDWKETDKLLENENLTNDVYSEFKESGSINFRIYKSYVNAGGGICMILLIFLCYTVYQITDTATLPLMTNWVSLEEKLDSQIQNTTETNFTTAGSNLNIFNNVVVMKYLYSLAVFLGFFISLWHFILCFRFSHKVSNKLHQKMTEAVFSAKMTFFQKYHYGNILNRFSKDIFIIDEILSNDLFTAVRATFMVMGPIIILIFSNYSLVSFLLIFLILAFAVCKYCLPTLRNLKRLESITLSPIVGYVNCSIQGLEVIRASKLQQVLQDEYDNYQNVNASVSFMLHCTSRGFLFGLDTMANLLLTSLIIFFMIFGQSISAGIIGLAISQVYGLTLFLRGTIEFWTAFNYHMTSVERVQEYSDREKESKSGQILENWPSKGEICYENVQLDLKQAKNILRNINFVIHQREKICIVGRTGAGKSSIISSLFRIYDVEGRITIDNIDVKLLNLEFLRSCLGIIPQDPILFTGTIRSNIDPNNKHTDESIWNILNKMKFSKTLSLDFTITNNGSQFSAGEKQLLCIARALLENKKIVIIDEATANIDSKTECGLQKSLKYYFDNCTLLVVTHKLRYINQYDKVMVVDNGEIVEFEKPANLLNDETSTFYKMYHQFN